MRRINAGMLALHGQGPSAAGALDRADKRDALAAAADDEARPGQLHRRRPGFRPAEWGDRRPRRQPTPGRPQLHPLDREGQCQPLPHTEPLVFHPGRALAHDPAGIFDRLGHALRQDLSPSRNIIARGRREELNAPPSLRFRPVMEHHKIDSIDLRILSELQANGRITNVELSRRAKITAPPCLRRMRALEKAGYIKGYHADLDAKMLGYEVRGFVFVGLSSQAEADLKRFEEAVRGWPQVRECHMLSGEVDFLLKVVAKDLSSFQYYITDTLTAAKTVASVKSSLVIHATKREPGVPIEIK